MADAVGPKQFSPRFVHHLLVTRPFECSTQQPALGAHTKPCVLSLLRPVGVLNAVLQPLTAATTAAAAAAAVQLLVAKSLNATQLATFLSTIRDMLSRVEAKQLPTLRERDQLQKLSTSDDAAVEYAAREQLPPARPPPPLPMRTAAASAHPIASIAPVSSIAPAAAAMRSPHVTVADPFASIPPLGSGTSTHAAATGAAWADQQHGGAMVQRRKHATQPGNLLDL